ncbi:MAG: CYTH and CHAD domain-containing protein [Actinomycetota bacterium]|nr:CYTH and CHAD domain-containing protein [Actinomycetota bacterium]
MRTAVEREAKFEGATATAVPTLAGVADGASEVELATITLTATYYDTADLRLLGRHLTLRHRGDRAGTGEDGWTLKMPGSPGGPGSERIELAWPGPHGPVPTEAVALTAAVTRGAALQPVARIITVRRRREVRSPTGARLAEIDDDDVTGTGLIAGSDGREPNGPLRFREIEVELVEGDASVLARAARRLTDSGFAPSAEASKLHRVLAGRDAVVTGRAGLDSRSTLHDVVAASIADGLDRLVGHDLAVRAGGDRRGIHQARVATRRLRSDLKTFRRLLDPVWVGHTRTTLKWVADALGDVRDADVLAERLAGHRSTAAEIDSGGFDDLTARLTGERDATMVNLRDILNRPRYLELLEQLEHAATTPPWVTGGRGDPGRPAGPELGRLVRRPWRQLRRAVDRLGDEPDDRELHRVRIKAKQVRYAAEMAAPVVGRPAVRLAKGAKALQGALGDHNDAVDAEAWLRRAGSDLPARVVLAAGQAIALERRQQAITRRAWPDGWRKASRPSRRRWMH